MSPLVITQIASTWDAVREELLRADARCLWQDLDGLHHHAPAPDRPPPTSIFWAWSATAVWRPRLDGDRVHGARLDDPPQADPVTPWAQDDHRVDAFRPADPTLRIGDVRIGQIVVDGIADRTGPVTFLRAVTP